MNIFFWQPIPSVHQSPAIRHFSKIWNGEVHMVWYQNIAKTQLDFGYDESTWGEAKTHYVTGNDAFKKIKQLLEDNKNDVHIFSGLYGDRKLIFAFKYACKFGIKNIGISSEAGRVEIGYLGQLKFFRSYLAIKRYKKFVKFVLAIGTRGQQYWNMAGVPSEKIFPYLYQSESPRKIRREDIDLNKVKFVFVGRFVPEKGLQLLLNALSSCSPQNWELTVIGDGPKKDKFMTVAKKLKIFHKIKWKGIILRNDLIEKLGEYDVAIIPSYCDGWNVVANEAIQAGLPIIVSNKCGSRDLAQFGNLGYVFEAGNKVELTFSLERILRYPEILENFNVNIQNYAPNISGERVAEYIKEVFSYILQGEVDRPIPPWYNSSIKLNTNV